MQRADGHAVQGRRLPDGTAMGELGSQVSQRRALGAGEEVIGQLRQRLQRLPAVPRLPAAGRPLAGQPGPGQDRPDLAAWIILRGS